MRFKRSTALNSIVYSFYTLIWGVSAQAAVQINEIAWMGTTSSASDEWIELYNDGPQAVSLDGWQIRASDGTPTIALSGTIAAGGFFLLERTDDSTLPHIAADLIYTGALSNTGETLSLLDASAVLVDSVSGWSAGNNDTKATMERVASGWQTATASYDAGFGTPRAANTGSGSGTPQFLNQVSEVPGAINVYFNKSALTGYASPSNAANHQINLEQRLISRISGARTTLDVATYEINLPGIADAIIERAAAGVAVRLIADSKAPSDPDGNERYQLMRLTLERILRGADRIVGTADDAVLLADSPIFAVEDSAKRMAIGLPSGPIGLPFEVLNIGNGTESGFVLALGELKAPDAYYSASSQMHNKFVIVDGDWVWTGSWNFTLTGLYGSEANRDAGILDGNQQHALEIRDVAVAAAFTDEFNEMWGSATMIPDLNASDFHGRKSDNTPHFFTVGGRTIEVYFSPGDGAVDRLTAMIADEAEFSAYFEIFAWSDQPLVDALKVKWEGSAADLTGTLTGFDVRGVFDSSFWNQWWSASIEMTGRTASQTSVNNPNIRWNNPAPVFRDSETRKLHAKSMLIDVCSVSDPSVVVGSTNWSANGEDVNDENMVIIHDYAVANQFLQQFYARYQAAGGDIPMLADFDC
ncbi:MULTISPECIES: phospholipase D-like domain-containing protein [unclassified Iodidimonas]|jgi:phosphatidylserine/phosphatidylglycerophosphate/cardiolipin synthase-like enzyme|uniref:phospholipase D-like domain-containing protein n=1 Tax=unclassified Iodidimonas TaxID=2626145 RepID=UPI0024822B99|nr:MULTISPECIES: phospholipase D-like domain-containing protein [unclassified Iodidimonas]